MLKDMGCLSMREVNNVTINMCTVFSSGLAFANGSAPCLYHLSSIGCGCSFKIFV
jgi:hypothetical protein